MGPKGISIFTLLERGKVGCSVIPPGSGVQVCLRWNLCVHLGLEGPSLDRQPDIVICHGQNEARVVYSSRAAMMGPLPGHMPGTCG